MEAKIEDLQINGKIVSMSTEDVVADAVQIYDNGMLKFVNTGKQNDINAYFKNKTDVLNNNIYDINDRIDNIEAVQSIPLTILSQILVIK